MQKILLFFTLLFFKEVSGQIPIYNHGVRIAYTDTGKGDTTLFFVHGWCLNRSYWTAQEAYFSHRYRVIAVDLPGFGESGKNRTVWTTAAFATDLDAVIWGLHLKHVILIGHSMAGHIILEAAIRAPGKIVGLVGVENFKHVGHLQSPEEKAAYIQGIEQLKHNFHGIATQYFTQALFSNTTPAEIKQRILNDLSHVDTTIAAACMEPDDFDEVKELKTANKKLYLINSDTKPTDTTGFITHHLPYRLFLIHGTGHFPMVEKPDDFNTLLSQALSAMTTE